MRNGQAALGVKHLDACRLRVEQAMRDADHPRLERAEGRQLGELERRAAARADEAAAAPPAAAPATPLAAPALVDADAPPWQPWHAGVDADGLDADGAFESMRDSNGDTVMRVDRAKGHKRVRFRAEGHTGTASASSAPITADRAEGQTLLPTGRLHTQLSEQTLLPTGRLHIQLSEQTLDVGTASASSLPLLPSGRLDTQTFAVRTARVVELYSPPRVTQALPVASGLVAGSTFDLHADVDGVRWDFDKPQDRKRAWERIRAEEPFLVIGSPPCTMFSSLQNLSATKGTAEWKERRRSAEVLLIFAAAVYKLQVLSGRHFLH